MRISGCIRKRLWCTDNRCTVDNPEGIYLQSLSEYKSDRKMFFIVLNILAISFNPTFSHRIDDVILQFVADVTPILFAPSKISLHTCISQDDTIRLSREMSNYRLIHRIHNFVEDFEERIYDNLEHRNLYMLDLDCDYAIEILRQAHSKKMFRAPIKWLLVQDRRMIMIDNTNKTTSITYNKTTSNTWFMDVFEDLAIYPDSDVVLAQRFDGDFFHLMSVYRPSPQRAVIWENRGNWTFENVLRMSTFDASSTRRRNLQQTVLKSCIVMLNPDTINHLTDFVDNTIDPITKANYIWVVHLGNHMNATVKFEIIHNNWGSNKNGTWDGMLGMLQRREIDIGGTALFLVANRFPIVEYIQLYTRTRVCFVFRRPLLSTVKNIFIMPFQRNVWIAIAIFLVLGFCLLHISMKWEHHRGISKKSAAYYNQLNVSESTVSENLLILLGTVTQQGYSYEPYRIPSRIITLMLLLTSLSLYAAYTANIVSLLQTTSDSIKTLSDLLYSPLTLGVQEIRYNRNYFQSSQNDPVRKRISQKVGNKSNWMSLEEGVRRMRNEPFAFHGIRGPIYHIMQRTYQEEEKCGLTEIDYLTTIPPLFIVQKHSPYLEIIKNGALKLREYGLAHRDEYRLYTGKPTCSSRTSFITIGFTECYFAIVVMGYGALLSVIVFALELLWYKSTTMLEETVHPVTAEETNLGTVNYID